MVMPPFGKSHTYYANKYNLTVLVVPYSIQIGRAHV